MEVRNVTIDTLATAVSATSGAAYSFEVNGTVVRAVSTDISKEHGAPAHFALSQNYPNPFNPSTTIGFTLPSRASVTLRIYDMLGRNVATLVNGETLQAGTYSKVWNAADFAGGVYFYRLEAGQFTETRKIIFLK